MKKERGKNIKDLESFLAEQQLTSETEPGQFTLNKERALETLLDSLKLEPEGFCRHLLVAAYLGGATSVEYTIPRKVSSYQLTGSYSINLKFDGEPLLEEDLEQISVSETLLSQEERLRRFALAYHQAVAFGSPWMRLSVWDVDKLTILTIDRGKVKLKKRAPVDTRKYRRQTLIEFRLPRIMFQLGRGPLLARRLAAGREHFESSTHWSPMTARLNKNLLPKALPPEGSLGVTYWTSPKLTAWIEPNHSNTAIIPVWCGLTLPEMRVNPKEWELPAIPGLRIVIASNDFQMEPTGLRPIQGPAFRKLVDKALRQAEDLLDKLSEDKSPEARTYFLSNWSRLQHLPLDTYPLFKTKEGEYLTLQSLRERRASREELVEKLTTDDATYALRLLQVSHFYRFFRGTPPPDEETVHPKGTWVSMRRNQWLTFAPIESSRNSHRCPLPQVTDIACWHPTEPWYAFHSDSELVVWDLKLERVWHRRKGEYRNFQFSTYGRNLYLFEKVAPSRIRVSQLKCADFDAPAVSTQVPGNKPVVVGSLLLLWLNPLCFHVLRLPELNKRLEHFTTREPIQELLDCSPCGQYALLGGPTSTYLFGTEDLTLKRLPETLKTGKFSWHSDYVFAQNEHQPLVIHLETMSTTLLAPRIVHFSRSGRTTEVTTEIEKPPQPLPPGVRLFDRVRLQSRNLLQPTQSSQGRRSRNVELLRTSGKNFSHTLILTEQDPPKLFCTHGTIQTDIYVDPRNFVYLSTPTPGGTRFHNLYSPDVPVTELGGTTLFRGTPVKLQNKRILLLAGLSGNRIIGSVSLDDTDSLRLLGSCLTYRTGDSWKVVSRSAGGVYYEGPQPVKEKSLEWFVSNERGTTSFSNFKTPNHWLPLEGQESARLHPYENLALAETDGFSALFKLNNWGAELIKDSRRVGTAGSFSPSGEHYFLINDHQLTIHSTAGSDKLKSLPLTQNATPRWLDDYFLQVGQQVWWRTESEDWGKARLTKWEFPVQLQHICGTPLCLIANNSEYQFLNLSNGRLVATYRPLADHWFLFTPDGFWDGSDGCLEYVRPWPKKPPKRNLLGSIVRQFGYIEP